MRIRDILSEKGHAVVTISPERPVQEAVELLVERNIGSVVVVEDSEVRGILTERDVLRLAARRPGRFDELRVAEVMTTDLVTAEPDAEIEDVMDVMTRQRVRHLPILHGHGLRGIVSIGDVVNALRESAQDENRHLKDYIRGITY